MRRAPASGLILLAIASCSGEGPPADADLPMNIPDGGTPRDLTGQPPPDLHGVTFDFAGVVFDLAPPPPDLLPPPPVPPLFSDAWKDNWNKARANNHPWAKVLLDACDRTGTMTERFDDTGLWCVIVYRLTGDPKYAARAWIRVGDPLWNAVPNDNELREHTTERAVAYLGLDDWFAQGNDARRQHMVKAMNGWCDRYVALTRSNDSDFTVGELGCYLWGMVSKANNPSAMKYLNAPEIGGLAATGADWKSVRNAVKLYTQAARGGEWIESTSYNFETLQLLVMATGAIQALTGKDHFPEATALYQEVALATIHKITSDLGELYQWGDDNHPRQFKHRLLVATTMMGMIAGVTANTANAQFLHRMLLDLAAKYGHAGNGSAEPTARFYLFYNPFMPATDRKQLPRACDAPGMGFGWARESWDASSALVGFHHTVPAGVDHPVKAPSDFQIYRRGEWAVTHPIVYDGNPVIQNTLLVRGLGFFNEVSARLAFEADAAYVYAIGAQGGNYYEDGYFQPPSTFLHEATRSFVYLPAADGKSVTLVIFDRVNADAPAGVDRYRPPDQAKVKGAPPKQLLFHAPVNPTIAGGTISWTSPGAKQPVRIVTLTPDLALTSMRVTRNFTSGFSDDGELLWVALATPKTARKFDTFLSVAQAYDQGAAGAVTRVVADAGKAEGALVSRAGHDDALVLFNARPGPNLPAAKVVNDRLVLASASNTKAIDAGRRHPDGFDVTFTATAGATRLYFADLDPNRMWTVAVDGGAAMPLVVSGAGIGRAVVGGPGTHTIKLR